MSMKRARKAPKAAAQRAEQQAPAAERRHNIVLREALDDLVDHVRWISRNVGSLTADELEYAQQRLEWMADEVWRLAVEEPGGPLRAEP